jgi:hypothetical protein
MQTQVLGKLMFSSGPFWRGSPRNIQFQPLGNGRCFTPSVHTVNVKYLQQEARLKTFCIETPMTVDSSRNASRLYRHHDFRINFDVRKSVHYHTIQINHPTRCRIFISLLLDVYVWLNMFREPLRPSSGAYNRTNNVVGLGLSGLTCQTKTNNAATATLQR